MILQIKRGNTRSHCAENWLWNRLRTFLRQTLKLMKERFYVIILHDKGLMKIGYQFLGAFARLRKATISFDIAVCPSARNNLSSAERIFRKADTRGFRENSSFVKI